MSVRSALLTRPMRSSSSLSVTITYLLVQSPVGKPWVEGTLASYRIMVCSSGRAGSLNASELPLYPSELMLIYTVSSGPQLSATKSVTAAIWAK